MYENQWNVTDNELRVVVNNTVELFKLPNWSISKCELL